MLLRTDGALSRRNCLASAGFFALALSGLAREGQAQDAAPLLRVLGPSGEEKALSEADIAALPWVEIETHTRWTDGVKHFRGPRLRDVLALTGLDHRDAEGGFLAMVALNDFRINVPMTDVRDFDPILAREMDGEIMRVRDYGPLWLVYPRDDYPELQDALFDERWIWQLSEIVIR